MNKIYCLLLGSILLSGCFGMFKGETMPPVEVATAKEDSNVIAADSSIKVIKTQPTKRSSNAEKKILAASNLDAGQMAAYVELEIYAQNFVVRSNDSFVPRKTKPKIEEGNGYVSISYMEIDHKSINLEILPAKSKYFDYIAKMRYVERHFQSTGVDFASAMNGQFKILTSRRVTELPRYIHSKWVE